MGHGHMHTKEFVVGAAVGSLLGSVAALLVAPKAGKKLRAEICDAYCNISDKTQDLASKGKSLAKSFGCQTCGWVSKGKSAVDGAKESIRGWGSEEEEEETTRDLLIGGLVGGILGATVGLLLAPKSGEALRQDISDTYEDMSERTHDFANDVTKKGKSFAKKASSRANKWLDLAKEVVDGLTDEVEEKGEDWVEHVKGLVNNKHANKVMDWAHLGYRLWQGIQSKR